MNRNPLWEPNVTKEKHIARIKERLGERVDAGTWDRLNLDGMTRYQLEALWSVIDAAVLHGMEVERRQQKMMGRA